MTLGISGRAYIESAGVFPRRVYDSGKCVLLRVITSSARPRYRLVEHSAVWREITIVGPLKRSLFGRFVEYALCFTTSHLSPPDNGTLIVARTS